MERVPNFREDEREEAREIEPAEEEASRRIEEERVDKRLMKDAD